MRLRPATMADAELLLRWRNEPATRAASFSSDEIDIATHEAWLERTLADPDAVVLIAEADALPVAQVRVNRTGRGAGEIHVVVAPEARGRGLGREVLTAGAAEAAAALGLDELVARVKPENEASLRAFRAAGFGDESEADGMVALRWRARPG